MFTDYKYAAQIRGEQAHGKDLDLADLRSAGTQVTVAGGHGTEYGLPIPTLSSPDQAQAFVDARIAEGSDYIKLIYDDASAYGAHRPSLTKEELAALVVAAHKRGKLVVCHIGSLQQARDAINAGVDGLAHLFVDRPPDPDFGKFVAAHHAFVVATLTALESVSGHPSGQALPDDPRLAPYSTPGDIANLQTSFPKFSTDLKLEYAEEAVRQIKAAGVPILAGTDAGNPGTSHGVSLHRELELLVNASLTPTEALAAATATPAAAFHLDDRGVIAPGKRADLLLVKGDPTRDIMPTRDIVAVWKLGVEDDRADYRAALDKDRAAAEAAKKQPGPIGSESGLVSDFEDGTASTKYGAGWTVSTDSIMGGKSTATMEVVAPGAIGSKGALEIDGEIAPGLAYAFAGLMFSPGTHPMAPANLASKKVVQFWARNVPAADASRTSSNTRTYRVMVFAKSLGMRPSQKTLTAGPEWKEFQFPISAFGSDGHDMMGCSLALDFQPESSRCRLTTCELNKKQSPKDAIERRRARFLN
jgi:Amidohydrolase family